MPERPSVVIVTPASASANNGNWRTAARWARLLRAACDVRIVQRWPDAAADRDGVMLALHARRSARSVQAWFDARGAAGLGVVLTGTDLYGDLAHEADAQRSVELAARLVVLQDMGVQALPPASRGKARVIYQSDRMRRPLPRPRWRLTAVMVGHLREVKSPGTFFAAADLLAQRRDIRLRHIGAAGDARWAAQAAAVQQRCANYRWLGPLRHGPTLAAIGHGDVLVHPSAMEGGAHAILEAVCAGVPVLASRVPGNVGMLGPDYDGYFPHGDAQALVRLLEACRAGQGSDDPAVSLLARLRAQCALRAPLFAPGAERRSLLQLIAELHPRGWVLPRRVP